jgi:hypothetical protein
MSDLSSQAAEPRIVVNLVGDAVHGRLAESRFVDRPFLPGGEQNLYEFAFAVAALGREVELRGWLDRPVFERMAAGAGARPAIDLAARRPAPDDLVVVPEGWVDPLDYARLLLSPARLAIFILAAPGLFGWPFVGSGWKPVDPLTVSLDQLARPEYFRGMAALGFRLLTHSAGIADAAVAAGVECAFIGTGRPNWTAPPPADKTIDVAAIGENRWAPFADRVLDELDGYTTDRIERVSNDELVSRLGRARVLLWPSRIEGHATIPWEARGVGCVPVALSSNRFAVGLDEAHGAVLVDTVEEIAPAIRSLLGEPERWESMSRLGRETAPRQVDWDAYVGRVGGFLRAPVNDDPSRPPLAAIGDALAGWLDRRAAEAQAQLEERVAEIEIARSDLTVAMKNQEQLLAEISYYRSLHDQLLRDNSALRAEKDRVTEQLNGLLGRRSVRAALKVADSIGTNRT